MFGYVRPFKPNLTYRQMEAYKALYCALCEALGTEYGLLARMTLSYDGACLALLGASLSVPAAKLCVGRCTCNPLKKCVFYRGQSEASYAAAVNVLLSEARACDGVQDETGLRRIGVGVLQSLLRRASRKAAQREPDTAEMIRTQLANQRALEKACCAIPDQAAEPTANMTAYFFTHFAQDDTQKRILGTMGYQFGRWIYFADALDDLQKDCARGRYNPIAAKFDWHSALSEEQLAEAKSYGDALLCGCEAQIAGAWALAEPVRLNDIWMNLIYEGLPAVRKQLPRRKKQEELHERSI